MPSTERKQRLFEDVLRLRRAEQSARDSRDIAAVRSHLERELGETVSRSLAARLIGVSHTGLQKWIDTGDVPVVMSRSGRQEVPVTALIDLHEATSSAREGGRRLHVMEPGIVESRNRAAELEPAKLVSTTDGSQLDPHDRAERRNRAYHAAIGRRLTRQLADRALHQLWRWSEEGTIDPRYADEWERLLRGPLRDVKRVLREDTQRARDLRQNSPFAGLLSEPERRKILSEIR
jgi:hypothetical protein